MNCSVSPLKAPDYPGWSKLFAEYCQDHHTSDNIKKIVTVWNRLLDGNHPLQAIVARNEMGEIVGLIHFQSMPDALKGTMVGYIADVYVRKYCPIQIEQSLRDAFSDHCHRHGWR